MEYLSAVDLVACRGIGSSKTSLCVHADTPSSAYPLRLVFQAFLLVCKEPGATRLFCSQTLKACVYASQKTNLPHCQRKAIAASHPLLVGMPFWGMPARRGASSWRPLHEQLPEGYVLHLFSTICLVLHYKIETAAINALCLLCLFCLTCKVF